MIRQMHEQEPTRSIRQACQVLAVNRAWYYEAQAALPSSQQTSEVALREAIEGVVLEFPGYGYRRVAHALKRQGWQINHKRVLRVMREESLLCQLKRRLVTTTDSRHGLPG